MNFSLADYIKIESKHTGWNVDKIQISLTSDEEQNLALAGQAGYSLVTEENFDGKAGGSLILYKNGSQVNPKKSFRVPGFTRTIVGFSVK